MYKVMIIDDEQDMREGLEFYLDKFQPSFDVVLSVDDGAKAIGYLKSNPVDVVLTDIRMYEVSGIDVAKYIHENFPQVKVIFISAYQEFEYAKKGMEYHVTYFLSKPTDIRELDTVFQSLKKELDAQYALSNQDYKVMRNFIGDILSGGLQDEKKVDEYIENNTITLRQFSGFVFELTVQNFEQYMESWQHGKEGMKFALQNLCAQNNGTYIVYLYFLSENIIVGVAVEKDADHTNEHKSEEFIRYIQHNAKELLSLSVFIVPQFYYNNIYELLNYNFVNQFANRRDVFIKEVAKLIVFYLTSPETESILKVISDFLKKFISKKLEDKKKLLQTLAQTVIDDLKQNNIANAVTKAFADVYWNRILLCKEDSLEEESAQMYRDLKYSLNSERKIMEQEVIDRAKKYILENYNRDISIEDVAEAVFLSPTYFSKFFKRLTGESYIDYIIKLRINKAIELLKTKRYKIFEVCDMVGYKSSKYFSYQFKQCTGYSPSDYCKKVLMHEE